MPKGRVYIVIKKGISTANNKVYKHRTNTPPHHSKLRYQVLLLLPLYRR